MIVQRTKIEWAKPIAVVGTQGIFNVEVPDARF